MFQRSNEVRNQLRWAKGNGRQRKLDSRHLLEFTFNERKEKRQGREWQNGGCWVLIFCFSWHACGLKEACQYKEGSQKNISERVRQVLYSGQVCVWGKGVEGQKMSSRLWQDLPFDCMESSYHVSLGKKVDVGDFVGSGQKYQDILACWPLCSSLSSQERTFLFLLE